MTKKLLDGIGLFNLHKSEYHRSRDDHHYVVQNKNQTLLSLLTSLKWSPLIRASFSTVENVMSSTDTDTHLCEVCNEKCEPQSAYACGQGHTFCRTCFEQEYYPGKHACSITQHIVITLHVQIKNNGVLTSRATRGSKTYSRCLSREKN